MTSNLTCHARFDRSERLEYIIDTIGVGKEVCQMFYDVEKPCTKVLTTTGVIIIKSTKNQVITAFIATMGQAQTVWSDAHNNNGKQMPPVLRQKIRDNIGYQRRQPC